jgi:hypothetical protein
LAVHPNEEYVSGGMSMSQKREKGFSQKGKPMADTTKQIMAAEDLETAIHPRKRQNSTQ